MAQSQYETQSTLSGLFKEVYESKIVNLVPESSILQKRVKFVEDEKREGNKLHQPVLLSLPLGLTFGTGAVTLNNPIASTLQDAQITGAGMTLADRITYDVAAKAASGGVRSFIEATELIVDALTQAMSKAIEIELLYGTGSAFVTGDTGTLGQASASTNVNATTQNLTIDTAEWSAGIWSGMENASLDIYNGTSKVNTNAAIVVSFVTVATRVVQVTGNSSDITSINGLTGTPLQLYFFNAYGNEMVGFHEQLNRSSTTLFNIAQGSFALWQPNTYAVGSTALNFGKIQSAVALATARGLLEDVIVLVNPVTYANLVTSQAGARLYDSSWKKAELENGTESLTFYGPNGKIEIMAHLFVKQGYAYVLPPKRIKRVGATDLTFTLPGMPGEFFLQSPTVTAYELRCYSLQAGFLDSPAKAVGLTGITNQ